MPLLTSKGNQVGLKLNGAHEFLVFANYVGLLEDNMNTIKKSTKAQIDPSKEVCLEANRVNQFCVEVSSLDWRTVSQHKDG
jgi:hypothetical protein